MSDPSADWLFFAAHPGRSYRLRQASFLDVLDIVTRRRLPPVLPVGYAWFAVVREIDPHIRLSVFVGLPRGTACDVPEAEARALWERCTDGPGTFDCTLKHASEHTHTRVDARVTAPGTTAEGGL